MEEPKKNCLNCNSWLYVYNNGPYIIGYCNKHNICIDSENNCDSHIFSKKESKKRNEEI